MNFIFNLFIFVALYKTVTSVHKAHANDYVWNIHMLLQNLLNINPTLDRNVADVFFFYIAYNLKKMHVS